MTTVIGATQRIIVNKPSNKVVVQGYSPSPDPGALNDLSDVSVPSPTDGYALTFNGGSGLWVPKKLVEAAGDTMTGPLNVASTSDVSLVAGSGDLVVGTPASYNIGIDNNEIQARDGTSPAVLTLQNEGGLCAIGPASARVNWDPASERLYGGDYRQFIRGKTETAGSTLVPVIVSGRYTGTCDQYGEFDVSFGETFPDSSTNVVVTSWSTSGATANLRSVWTTGFKVRCVGGTGTTFSQGSQMTIDWMAFGRRAA